jgi:serine/threonine protein kinase/tetratricopeptide (TPR) repeat protein
MSEEEIFYKARSICEPAERAAYLEQAFGGDAAMMASVEALLQADVGASGFMDRPPPGPDATIDVPVGERPGTLIGPYKLLQEIGEGGMGTVFMAEQTEPVRRKVALKLVRPGMDSRQIIARFEAERQALAMMDHPNIAKVLDAGSTATGRPYFVMELVEGIPITDYCDQNHLSPRQRLELFIPVCQAIQHAHQKGVIHRDLKPSNVLVARYDDVPVPKVIDFGVAKATGSRLTERTLFTQYGQLVGTLEYMSPEQAAFNALDIDTRRDIYSLGVLLYELLTGSTPFEKTRLRTAAFDEVLRIIREEEPPRPSTRLSTTEELPSISASRGMEPRQLSGLLRRELDWVVMKALEKDRNRRYESAGAFAADVRRYLDDEPVQACPPSAGYRLRKFVRRNRGMVVASVALAAVLIAGMGSVMAVQARADRERAAAAADRAMRQAATDASIAAAIREARERADEAWGVSDYPDRMQRATDAAVAAVRRADEFAAGGLPGEGASGELESTRRAVGDLARNARLISDAAENSRKFADEMGGSSGSTSVDLCKRAREALRRFGLDPVAGPANEAARAVADSRIRDALLGMMLEWHNLATYHAGALRRSPGRADIPADTPVIADRLGRLIRSTRQLSGGAYARWQDLLDRNDVPGLVAFAGSPDALRFRSTLVGAIGRDLLHAKEHRACQAYLRAAVDRYPHDAWLHNDLATVCNAVQPADRAESLRHHSAASALRPNCAWFLVMVARSYADLGADDQAIAAYRKVIAMSPFYTGIAHLWMGDALSKKKDWEAAIAAIREAIRLLPERRAKMYVPQAHRDLGLALAGAGRHAEARHEMLASLHHDAARAGDPRNYIRYNAACFAMYCADGKGMNTPAPTERAAYRKQSLDLLTTDLAAIRELAVTDGAFVHRAMQVWLRDADLASVREPAAVDKLPQDKRDAWRKLWADVRELRDRSAPQAGPPDKSK